MKCFVFLSFFKSLVCFFLLLFKKMEDVFLKDGKFKLVRYFCCFKYLGLKMDLIFCILFFFIFCICFMVDEEEIDSFFVLVYK